VRSLNKIVIHCSATPEGRDVKADTIRDWHVKERGWSDIGYHFIIELDGTLVEGRPLERSGAHTKGHNRNSVGICYIGGVDENMKAKDTRSDAQIQTLNQLILSLCDNFNISIDNVHGHNEFSPKSCPSFDVKELVKELKEIYYE
jgi:N-acetylmuramoyl-L-alanine amidase